MSPDKKSGTQCRGRNIMRTKCYWSKCRVILSTTCCPMTFCPHNILSATFFRDILSGDISPGHPCRYTATVQPARQKWGYVESLNRKFKQWSLVRTVSGWLVCGRSNRWIVDGWIYSKPVGWLVCLLVSVIWSDLWSVFGLPAGLFAIQSVVRLNHPAGLLYPTYHRLTSQPSIHLSAISAWVSGLEGSTSPHFCSAGWLRWGYLTHACKSLAKFGAYSI